MLCAHPLGRYIHQHTERCQLRCIAPCDIVTKLELELSRRAGSTDQLYQLRSVSSGGSLMASMFAQSAALHPNQLVTLPALNLQQVQQAAFHGAFVGLLCCTLSSRLTGPCDQLRATVSRLSCCLPLLTLQLIAVRLGAHPTCNIARSSMQCRRDRSESLNSAC